MPGEAGSLAYIGTGDEFAAGLREAPDVRVLGVVPIVAHHEVTAVGNPVGGLPEALGRNIRILRIERLSVDVDAGNF